METVIALTLVSDWQVISIWVAAKQNRCKGELLSALNWTAFIEKWNMKESLHSSYKSFWIPGRKEKEWDNNQIESVLCKFWIKFKRGFKDEKEVDRCALTQHVFFTGSCPRILWLPYLKCCLATFLICKQNKTRTKTKIKNGWLKIWSLL